MVTKIIGALQGSINYASLTIVERSESSRQTEKIVLIRELNLVDMGQDSIQFVEAVVLHH